MKELQKAAKKFTTQRLRVRIPLILAAGNAVNHKGYLIKATKPVTMFEGANAVDMHQLVHDYYTPMDALINEFE